MCVCNTVCVHTISRSFNPPFFFCEWKNCKIDKQLQNNVLTTDAEKKKTATIKKLNGKKERKLDCVTELPN